MGDQGDSLLRAALDDPAAQGAIVVDAECHLDRRDRSVLECLVELEPVDVRHADAPHHTFVGEPRERTHGGPPGSTGIGCVNEIEVDGKAVEGSEARLAVGANRLCTAVRDPAVAGPCHAAFGDDARPRLRAARLQTADEQPFVVAEIVCAEAVRMRGVEDGDTCLGRCRDRLEGELLVPALVGRHPHAAEADAELRGVEPAQETEPMPRGS